MSSKRAKQTPLTATELRLAIRAELQQELVNALDKAQERFRGAHYRDEEGRFDRERMLARTAEKIAGDQRAGAIMALEAVAVFLEADKRIALTNGSAPLVALGLALKNLDRGVIHPMLVAAMTRGRTPNAWKHEANITYACVAMSWLMEIEGTTARRPAAELVKDRLDAKGIKVNGAPPTADTVIRWREDRTRDPRGSPEREHYHEVMAASKERICGIRRGIEQGEITLAEARDEILNDLAAALSMPL